MRIKAVPLTSGWSWRCLWLAVLGGLLLYAGHPPVGAGLAGYVAVVPLVALARDTAGTRRRLAFGYGYLAGLVAFAPLLYWLIPFGYAAFGGLTLVQAAYIGAFVAVVAAYGERRGRPVFTVAAWVALEALRGTWPFGGFTWGALAYTQADGGLVLEVARTLGAAGISLILVTVAVAVEEAIRAGHDSWTAARDSDVPADTVFRAVQRPVLTVLAVLTVAVLIGGDEPAPTGSTTSFGIVQGGDTRGTSAAGVRRLDTGRIIKVAELMADQTTAFSDDPPDVVIWPENSLDSDIRSPEGEAVAALLEQSLAAVSPSPILAGEAQDGPTAGTWYNNMTVFTEDGPGQSYTKRRPVPFAEYVPLRPLFDWFPPLDQVPQDVVAADQPQVIDVAGAHVGTIICFENTFPHLVRSQVRAGADVLVVSTNNSSFGFSPMSAQHIAFSRVRAVETGRWVVHAGISGISGFISPTGEVFDRTEQFEPATIRMDVPLIEELTPATRVGDGVAYAAWLVTAAGLGFVLVDRRRSRG